MFVSSMRLLDIRAPGDQGIVSDIHGFENAAKFSDAIRAAAKRSHGRAGPLFVRHLIEALSNGLDLVGFLNEMIGKFGVTPNSQERRAARTLAIAAMAGEIATAWDRAMGARRSDTFCDYTLPNLEEHAKILTAGSGT